MRIEFIGTGSAFNTDLGNNNAMIHFGENDEYSAFIDCGTLNFDRLMKRKLLERDQAVFFITHTHPDHIGSLGDAIFYMYFARKPILEAKTAVVAHPDLIPVIRRILKDMGVMPEYYNLIPIDVIGNKIFKGIEVEAIQTTHTPTLESYAFLFSSGNEVIYYSGDANEFPLDIRDRFLFGEIDHIYQDTCVLEYPNNPHMSLSYLASLIPSEDRHRVTCMHLDNAFNPIEARALGFNVAESIK